MTTHKSEIQAGKVHILLPFVKQAQHHLAKGEN